VIVLGTAALVLRRVGPEVPFVTVLVGLAGLLTTVSRRDDRAGGWDRLFALAAGLAAFGLGTLVASFAAGSGGAARWAPLSATAVVSVAVAGVAEEAFFRRLVYGALLPLGAVAAVGGAGALFALVHIPLYGVETLPLNLGAGLVLGWQRWSTGDWTVPAVTHAAANLMQFA
jgi:membrane protease YdiL (CAAX protease family)